MQIKWNAKNFCCPFAGFELGSPLETVLRSKSSTSELAGAAPAPLSINQNRIMEKGKSFNCVPLKGANNLRITFFRLYGVHDEPFRLADFFKTRTEP